MRFLFAGLVVAMLTDHTFGQPKVEQAPSLQYTVRSAKWSRTSQNRESVLKTLDMTDDQVQAWAAAEDEIAVEENRSATSIRKGYSETIGRSASSQLQYTVRNQLGSRTSRDHESILKTVKMTADQIKAWADAPDSKAEGRTASLESKRVLQITVRNSKASVTCQDQKRASNALKLTDEQLWEWAKEEKAAKEGRAVIRFYLGYHEAIWRGSSGQILYGIWNNRGSTMGQDRESVLKTLTMTDDEKETWAQDENAAKEGRTAVFNKVGQDEIISRGEAEQPPGLEK